MKHSHFLFGAFLSATLAIHTPVKAQQAVQPGYHLMHLGDAEVITISDGTIPQEFNKLLTNTKPGEVDQLLKYNFQADPVEVSDNTFLIKKDGKLILIDAGTAGNYGPTLGQMAENLKRAGYTTDQIDIILITHIHIDHTGGLMNGDQMVFPNATIYISKPEVDFWFGKLDEKLKNYFDQAAASVGPYLKAGKIKTFTYGHELLPGITPLAAPGHTPGHTFYALESKGQKLVFLGDIMHAPGVQFADPNVTIVYDVDPKQAAIQRKKAFADAAKGGYWIAGDHVPFPGIGHVHSANQGYSWLPINYSTYPAF